MSFELLPIVIQKQNIPIYKFSVDINLDVTKQLKQFIRNITGKEVEISTSSLLGNSFCIVQQVFSHYTLVVCLKKSKECKIIFADEISFDCNIGEAYMFYSQLMPTAIVDNGEIELVDAIVLYNINDDDKYEFPK